MGAEIICRLIGESGLIGRMRPPENALSINQNTQGSLPALLFRDRSPGRLLEDLFFNANCKIFGVHRLRASVRFLEAAVLSPAMSERSLHIFARLFSAPALNISCYS